MRGRLEMLRAAGVAVALLWSGSCGSSPMSPGPVTPPVTVVNTPPVVESIVASASRAEVEKHFGIPEKDIAVVYNGTDADLLRPHMFPHFGSSIGIFNQPADSIAEVFWV